MRMKGIRFNFFLYVNYQNSPQMIGSLESCVQDLKWSVKFKSLKDSTHIV